MKFELGQTLITRGVAEAMQRDPIFAAFVIASFEKYCNCNWGNLCHEDKEMNEEAIRTNDDRILARYNYRADSDFNIYIITEWDRSATTILFTYEY